MIGLFMRSQWHNPPKAQMTVELLLRLLLGLLLGLRSFLTVNCGQCKRCTHKLLATLQQLQLSTQKTKMNKKNKLSGIIWFLLHGYAQTRRPRELDSKSTSLLNRMLQWSRKRRCIVASWSPRAVRGACRTFVVDLQQMSMCKRNSS